jgi:hypothetical protein
MCVCVRAYVCARMHVYIYIYIYIYIHDVSIKGVDLYFY